MRQEKAMATHMEPNFSDPGEPGVYIPTTVDASIRDILIHRGVPEARVAALLADLDGPCTLAEYELETLLPCARMTHLVHGHRHDFHVVLAEGVTWTGATLTLRADLPETILAALVGRSLREIIDHPCIPDRPILAVDVAQDGRLTLKVKTDARPVLELAGASDMVVAGIATRSRVRRAWIDRESGATCESDWSAWLDDQRAEGVRTFLSGAAQTFGEHCWGGRPLSPAPALRTMRWRLMEGIGRLLHWLRTPAAVTAS